MVQKSGVLTSWVEVGSLSHYLQGFFLHRRWLGMGFLPSTVGIKKNTRKFRKWGVWPQMDCFLMRGFPSTSATATVNCRVAMESIWTIKNQPSSCTTTNGTWDVLKGSMYIHSSIYHGIQNVQKPFKVLRISEEEEPFSGIYLHRWKNPYFPSKIPINYVKHYENSSLF